MSTAIGLPVASSSKGERRTDDDRALPQVEQAPPFGGHLQRYAEPPLPTDDHSLPRDDSRLPRCCQCLPRPRMSPSGDRRRTFVTHLKI
jgi:hypothetical protein